MLRLEFRLPRFLDLPARFPLKLGRGRGYRSILTGGVGGGQCRPADGFRLDKSCFRSVGRAHIDIDVTARGVLATVRSRREFELRAARGVAPGRRDMGLLVAAHFPVTLLESVDQLLLFFSEFAHPCTRPRLGFLFGAPRRWVCGFGLPQARLGSQRAEWRSPGR